MQAQMTQCGLDYDAAVEAKDRNIQAVSDRCCDIGKNMNSVIFQIWNCEHDIEQANEDIEAEKARVEAELKKREEAWTTANNSLTTLTATLTETQESFAAKTTECEAASAEEERLMEAHDDGFAGQHQKVCDCRKEMTEIKLREWELETQVTESTAEVERLHHHWKCESVE